MEAFGGSRKKKGGRSAFFFIALFLALIILFAVSVSQLGTGNVKRERESLENALTRDITECYAEEGHYPKDLYYMIEHYGLSYNEDLFFVDYRVRGGNIRPEFTIITLTDDE